MLYTLKSAVIISVQVEFSQTEHILCTHSNQKATFPASKSPPATLPCPLSTHQPTIFFIIYSPDFSFHKFSFNIYKQNRVPLFNIIFMKVIHILMSTNIHCVIIQFLLAFEYLHFFTIRIGPAVDVLVHVFGMCTFAFLLGI